LSERPVVLFDQLAELFWHFVRSREHDRAGVRVELSSQAELEALQAVGHKRLQPRELFDVLVHAVILELPKGTDDLVQLTRVDVLATQHTAQILNLTGVLTGLVAQLPDVFGRQANLTTLPPSAPRGSASPGATAIVAAGCETAAIASVAALATAVTSLLTAVLSLAIALTLSLTLLALSLLPLTLLTTGLLVVALLPSILLCALSRALLQRFGGTGETLGAALRILTSISGCALTESRLCLVEALAHLFDPAGDVTLGSVRLLIRSTAESALE
jgi:hypothetical protein